MSQKPERLPGNLFSPWAIFLQGRNLAVLRARRQPTEVQSEPCAGSASKCPKCDYKLPCQTFWASPYNNQELRQSATASIRRFLLTKRTPPSINPIETLFSIFFPDLATIIMSQWPAQSRTKFPAALAPFYREGHSRRLRRAEPELETSSPVDSDNCEMLLLAFEFPTLLRDNCHFCVDQRPDLFIWSLAC